MQLRHGTLPLPHSCPLRCTAGGGTPGLSHFHPMPSQGRKATKTPTRRSTRVLSRSTGQRNDSIPIDPIDDVSIPMQPPRRLRRPIKLTPKASGSGDTFLTRSSEDRLARAQQSTPTREDSPIEEERHETQTSPEASKATALTKRLTYVFVPNQRPPSSRHDSLSKRLQFLASAEPSQSQGRSPSSTPPELR